MPQFFDTPQTINQQTGEVTPGKAGLFSSIGNLLTYTAIGMKDPARLAEIEAQKAQAEREFVSFQQKLRQQQQAQQVEMMKQRMLQQALGGGQGGQGTFPVGTTLNYEGLNIPLNPRLTDEEKKIVEAGPRITNTIDEIVGYINTNGINMFQSMLVDSGNPLFVSGALEELQSRLNSLKAEIPFTQGGKQLTPFESKLLFRLLNITGKSAETIQRDLMLFSEKFGRLEQLASQGMNSRDFSKAKSELFSDISDTPEKGNSFKTKSGVSYSFEVVEDN